MMKAIKLVPLLGSTALAGMIALGHVGNLVIDKYAPTPEQFAAQNGQTYGEKATNILRSHADLRIIESGSGMETFYNITHPLHKLFSSPVEEIGKDSYHNTVGLAGILGEKTVLFMESKDGESMLPNVKRGRSDQEFSYILFHELGHHDEYKKRGPYALTLPVLQGEAYADKHSVESLSEEFSGSTKSFAINLRSIYIDTNDHEHDTLPALLDSQGVTASLSPESKTSYSAIRALADICLSKTNTPPLTQQSLHAIHDCLKSSRGKFSSAATASPVNVEMRALKFIEAYESFYNKLPTLAHGS